MKLGIDGCDFRAVQGGRWGGGGGQLPPPGKLNVFFSNIVFEFAGLCCSYIGPKSQENRLID